jgi:hypothetical protein
MNDTSTTWRPYISSLFGSYDVVGNEFKYTHYDLINLPNYLNITFTINVAFVTIVSSWLHVWSFVRFSNLVVMLKNNFEIGIGTMYVLRVRATINWTYWLWCLLTLHIMLMLLMIPYDPIPLFHRLCEMVHKDIWAW